MTFFLNDHLNKVYPIGHTTAAVGPWYLRTRVKKSENETAKERKKTQRRLTVMVTSLFAWPMTGAENYGHNSCHLLPSSFSLRITRNIN